MGVCRFESDTGYQNLGVAMQLNELRITSDVELEEWKKTWDGVSIPPAVVIEYYNTVVYPTKLAKLDKILTAFGDENSRTV